jgi:dephospho-CoA kinase
VEDEFGGPHRERLMDALRAARQARRGVPAALEPLVRAWAREQRESGAEVGRVLVDVKAMVRELMGDDELVFTPKVVGWTVAGYFATAGGRRGEA